MLNEQEKEIFAAARARLRTLPGMTSLHAYELETALDLVTRALTEPPEILATWAHVIFVIDPDMFEQAGYDVSDITKADLDTLADDLKDYWVGGKQWERALEYAAGGVLERKPETPEAEECACCAAGTFVPGPDGTCARCEHEHTDHEEGDA